jgi:uncharacterized protein YbdZ (MbtH family)
MKTLPSLLSALLTLGSLAHAEVIHDIDFEEPLHHLGQQPASGPPKGIAYVPFGNPTIVAGLDGQCVQLLGRAAYEQIMLQASTAGDYLRIEFDFRTENLFNQPDLEFWHKPYALKFILQGNTATYGTWVGFFQGYPGAEDGVRHHAVMLLDTLNCRRVLTVDGALLYDQWSNETMPTQIRVGVLPPNPLEFSDELQRRAYVDNIQVTTGYTGSLDFNGDRFSDLVLTNPATGQTCVQYLYQRGQQFVSVASGPKVPAGWRLIRVADLNRDGKNDFLLYKPSTGQLVAWLLDGITLRRSLTMSTIPTGWKVAATIETNVDGYRDLLLLNPTTGSLVVWLLQDGLQVGTPKHLTEAGNPKKLPAGWQIVGSADFNNDRQPDLVLFHPATRQTAIWRLSGTTLAAQLPGPTLPPGWSVVASSDLDNDSHPDYVIFQPSTRRVGVWRMLGTSVLDAHYVSDAAGVPIVETAGLEIVAP